MANRKDRTILRQLDTLFNLGAIRELTDGQLLERFATSRGEVAELAFAALVERHGAMVSRVCRAVLTDPHDTQDAFQATFLILVKKARVLWVRESLGPWLHQVAFRTATYARTSAARRRTHERRAAELTNGLDRSDDTIAPEFSRLLHEEINRLPERYRVPILLCDLEGHTCEEVARQMGSPVGTVKSWRARGRERLRNRLIRRGLAPGTLAAAIAADAARAAVLSSRTDIAQRILVDTMIAGEVSASVGTLVRGVLTTMFLRTLRTTVAMIFAVVFLAAGFGAFAGGGADEPKTPSESPRTSPASVDAGPEKPGREDWPLTLRDAIRIGLDSVDVLRVISIGGQAPPAGGSEAARPGTDAARVPLDVACVIAPRDPGSNVHRFRAETMAWVRSVEQSYWSLVQMNAQFQAQAKAVDMASEILKRVQSELKRGRCTIADVAEAEQRLERIPISTWSPRPPTW